MTHALEPGSAGRNGWLRELNLSLSLNSQVVLYGNIRDTYLVQEGDVISPKHLPAAIWSSVLKPAGYESLLIFHPVSGLRCFPNTPESVAAASAVVGAPVSPLGHPSISADESAAPSGQVSRQQRVPDLVSVIRQIVRTEEGRPQSANQRRVSIMVRSASRLANKMADLTPGEHMQFVAFEQLSHAALPMWVPESGLMYNQVLWVANNERDLPDWLTAGNDAIRKIVVPLPDRGERLNAARSFISTLVGYDDATPEQREFFVGRFASSTDGLRLEALTEIAGLAKRLGTPLTEIEDAARSYRVGVSDTPWKRPYLREVLAGAAETLSQRVIGQSEAVQRAVDILIRSVMGLSGTQNSSGTSPRGILFLAGPTGVGKTELAKAITELVFGDEGAYIRFDMSEFSAEHAADRLIGAPPGYVGHDAGGELTNAVRQRPFSLILFDEIEKAHGRILDKFLQILEDGRLTDGSGSTVYFSESILVFTSNLGIYVDDGAGGRRPNVTPDMPPEQAEPLIRQAVSQHFNEVLNRPELLNRLGDNILVFNFITTAAAERIFDGKIRGILARVLREQGVTITLSDGARQSLLEVATRDLSHGGRGIGSVIESAFVNPLARELFARRPDRGSAVTVESVVRDGTLWKVLLS